MEKRLLKSEREGLAGNQAKSEFLANMSHEIRTPMTAILGYADMLGDRISDEETRGYLTTIRRNGDYLLEIINDILDLSKIEAGKIDIDTDRFDPARVVEDVRSVMEVRATENNLKLTVDYATPIPRIIENNAKRLKQILINLVGNAVKFTKQGGVTMRVEYDRLEQVSPVVPVPERTIEDNRSTLGKLRFSVTDTGIGMTEQQRDRLFKPFSQGDSLITRQFGGTGLGLAISQHLAAMLGGEIVCDTEFGRGSTFTATIAIGEVEDIKLVKPRTHTVEFTDEEQPIGDIQLGAHILIVDDRRDIRFL